MLTRRKSRRTIERRPFLITWEGSDYEEEVKENGPEARCKVVAILSSRRKANELKVILSALFSAGYNFTLDEKVGHGLKQRLEEEALLSLPYPGKYRYGYPLHEFLFCEGREGIEVRKERTESLRMHLVLERTSCSCCGPDIHPKGFVQI